MGNIIQIKRGSGEPGENLAPYELGYDTSGGYLYIGKESEDAVKINAGYADGAQKLVNKNNQPYTAGSTTVPVYLDEGEIKPCNSGDVSLGMTVEAADRLSTPRTIRTNLNSTSEASFDGTANIIPGVTGTLPVTNGGTGVNSETALKTLILNMAYPVGSIYMSTQNVSPQTFLGGTWVQITDTFLLAAGSTYSAGGTGGSATVTLTQAQTPLKSHTHTSTVGSASFLIRPPGNDNRNITSANSNVTIGVGDTNWTYGIDTGVTVNAKPEKVIISPTVSIENTSNATASAHNNMPPYLTVYMWKRTA